MTFKVLIIEDNHSFIDSLKVMLRDMQLDFVHAFRYADALQQIEKFGTFYNRQSSQPATDLVQDETALPETKVKATGKGRGAPKPAPLYNEGGIFLIIVEQNTESSMKGTDFIAHVAKKYPGLPESDFVLLTHRLELVPAKNHGFPVLEKPLRALQIRQIVQQKLKNAQDTVEMQIRLAIRKVEEPEVKESDAVKPKGKGFRDFIKNKLKGEELTETASDVKKPAPRPRKSATKPKKSVTKAPVKKAKGK